MSSVPSAAPLPVVNVSPEAWEYVCKEGIEGPVRHLMEATPRLFPTARSIDLVLERDVELDDVWFVIFRVRMPITDMPEVADYIQAQNRWGEEWLRGYPYPRNHSIILDLSRVSA